MNLKQKTMRNFIWVAFIAYLLAVAILCFAPALPLTIPQSDPVPYVFLGQAPVIYLPFVELLHLDFYLNMLMTIPFGVFIVLLQTKPLRNTRVIWSGAVVGLFIELTQLILDNFEVTERWVDVNDILANGVGLCLGYWLTVCLLNRRKQQK